MSSTSNSNPLLQDWQGPMGGLPPFDQVQAIHFPSALQAGVDDLRASVHRLTSQEEPPDFANTIETFECCGSLLRRVRSVVGVFFATLSDAHCREIEAEWEPRLTTVWSEVYQNQKLFRRVQAVHASQESYNEEERRLIDEIMSAFRRKDTSEGQSEHLANLFVI